MSLILAILVGHAVGDFICQSDFMAIETSKRWDALTLHVIAYSAAVAVILAPALALFGGYNASRQADLMTWMAVNMVAHFVQDAITSRITARLWFVDGVRTNGAAIATYLAAMRDESYTDPWTAVNDEL